jgi:hypothetical protein
VSNTFAPPPRAKADTNQIPVDLQRFRLATGARVYVDFKSVPYAAEEVLEWRRRMDATIAFYAKPGREWLRREGVTRVVSPTNRPLAADYLREEFAGGGYVVYRVE